MELLLKYIHKNIEVFELESFIMDIQLKKIKNNKRKRNEFESELFEEQIKQAKKQKKEIENEIEILDDILMLNYYLD